MCSLTDKKVLVAGPRERVKSADLRQRAYTVDQEQRDLTSRSDGEASMVEIRSDAGFLAESVLRQPSSAFGG